MNDPKTLEQLSKHYGIAAEYTDNWGQRYLTSAETQRALLTAMGVPVAGEEDRRRSLEAAELRPWQRLLAPVQVIRMPADAPRIELNLPRDRRETGFNWALLLENGQRHEGQLWPRDFEILAQHPGGVYMRYGFPLPFLPEPGYHRFELVQCDNPAHSASMSLIVAPERCYQPPVLGDQDRVWGFALQLYGLRSQRNWGIGDFSDLKPVLEDAAQLGASMVGLNPLHALFPDNPNHVSPYSPSSRLFFNILYLDVTAIPDFNECPIVQDIVNDPQFQAQLRALRARDLVEYQAIGETKLSILERLYRHFREQHLNTGSPYGQAFRGFQRAEGETLRQQALFEALQAHFHETDPEVWGWPAWPEIYRNPGSEAVAAFAESHGEQVEFYEYLQWRTASQLEEAGRRSLELGLGIGLYQDLAVSVNGGGGEAWANQDLYALGARIGAPPDALGPLGQDWGLPPLNPIPLRESAYRPFIAMLRKNMRWAGALRIDHVMGLMRLFWIPAGGTPAEGAYVSYPLEDLLGILALESQRNRCLIIGEDLGTVPDAVRAALAPMGVLSYRLFYFEKESDGSFKAPDSYPRQALVAITTHDLPTLNGYWQGTDLGLRDELNLITSQQQRDAQIIERARDRAHLRMALERQGLLPADISVHGISVPTMTPELARAVHVYLARSPAQVMSVQLEDVFTQLEQVNLPGTMDEYPNWRRKLALNLEDWISDSRLQSLAEALREERGVPEPSLPTSAAASRFSSCARIPDATYRFQFNSGFTFAQAAELVPYLHQLGISHCYASPYLKARPGSTHGYDIIDHKSLNPEIGSDEDFERFSGALRQHGMGQILDVVPNHMGVMGSDNAWWLDVLENGPAATHAAFFDIDWEPQREGLRGKVLLPVLGDHYGTVLENGELHLVFDPVQGAFNIQYYEHRFPIDPREYPRILGDRLEQLEARMGSTAPLFLEYQSLVTGFSHLPERMETIPSRVAERRRDKEIHKKHLAELHRRSPDVAWFIKENVHTLNGIVGEPQSFDALHELLRNQAYWLAFWRVASDDINYRRFFDINDLAGLRMENEKVFQETHRRVIQMAEDGKLDGLRIDHPDGLHNPKQYFQRLQNSLVCPLPPDDADASGLPLYVVVEKILESYERLPEQWAVHGTTGYDFANLINALLIDPRAEDELERIYTDFIGEPIDFHEMLYQCKKLIINGALSSELNVLANQLCRIAQVDRLTQDFTLSGLRDTLEEVVASFPVYRTYITADEVSDDDRRYVDWAVQVAKKRSRGEDTSIFDFVHDVLLTDAASGKTADFRKAVTAFTMKFQQYTGPVMAKGLEDTSFYRYNRLVSLNEVGGDPRRFAISVTALHLDNQERARHWPHAMLSTSTHDSKRSEDVRARINVLSEAPREWERRLQRWSRLTAPKKLLVNDTPAPAKNDEYLLYQTLIGAWPLETMDPEGWEIFRARIEAYMLKAVKEAKVHSNWINPAADYEEAVASFVHILLENSEKNRFLADFLPFQRRVSEFGMYNSLAQTLLKLTSPGVPDIYQGTELWDFSLVDPDNRRPVDYGRRQRLVQELQAWFGVADEARAERARQLMDSMEDGRIKFYVIWKTLNLRRENSELFCHGDYIPLEVEGSKADHVCAFARDDGDRAAFIVVPRLPVGLLGLAESKPLLSPSCWEDTCLTLTTTKQRRYLNIFTGETVATTTDGKTSILPLANVLGHFPVALLMRV
jgi:(1->4)-alpha-D-glucan 1-alpha-D-glucosylmutase